METKRTILWGIAIVLSALTAAHAAPPVTRQGTSILHYTTSTPIQHTDVDTNAAGTLALDYKQQGGSLKQSFSLALRNLDTNTTYWLAATAGDDTNNIVVRSFTTDRRGNARISYSAHGHSNPHASAHGSLPDVLDPIPDVRAISILNAATQTVAFAWADQAARWHYMVKRNLNPEGTNTASGSISIISNGRNTGFRLAAGGLAPTSPYYLAFNSNIVSTVSSTTAGRLAINGLPADAPALLSIRLLQVLDASSNAVLSTTLPK